MLCTIAAGENVLPQSPVHRVQVISRLTISLVLGYYPYQM